MVLSFYVSMSNVLHGLNLLVGDHFALKLLCGVPITFSHYLQLFTEWITIAMGDQIHCVG